MSYEERTKNLMEVISILTKWVDEGIPDNGLVRIWYPDGANNFLVMDVANDIAIGQVFDYAHNWLHDIVREAKRGEVSSKTVA